MPRGAGLPNSARDLPRWPGGVTRSPASKTGCCGTTPFPTWALTRAAERRLLAGLTATALPHDADPAILRRLVEADALAARGDQLLALQEITRAYDAGVKAFETGQA